MLKEIKVKIENFGRELEIVNKELYRVFVNLIEKYDN